MVFPKILKNLNPPQQPCLTFWNFLTKTYFKFILTHVSARNLIEIIEFGIVYERNHQIILWYIFGQNGGFSRMEIWKSKNCYFLTWNPVECLKSWGKIVWVMPIQENKTFDWYKRAIMYLVVDYNSEIWLKIANFGLGAVTDLLSKMFRPAQLVEMGSIPTCPMGWSSILSAPRGQMGQNGMKYGQIGSNDGQNWNSIWQISDNCDISYCSEVIYTLSGTLHKHS